MQSDRSNVVSLPPPAIDLQKIVCMATDAFRLCVGLPPRNFSPAEIAAFVAKRARQVRG